MIRCDDLRDVPRAVFDHLFAGDDVSVFESYGLFRCETIKARRGILTEILTLDVYLT
jgi:hypothetical protein